MSKESLKKRDTNLNTNKKFVFKETVINYHQLN